MLTVQKLFQCPVGKSIKIRVSEILPQHNTSISGVDTLDKLLSSYRPLLRFIKRWWNLLTNTLNVAAW
ncbi:hypothetical protein T4A_4425 [Trichinella pseudospiralis]|uniref:Uncharacterized protein n=2 Tax=Trichinella pseudospiralis TaxID=6337 RepID=A0A0V1F5J0_TRIPS|nr:hypothetical protein T4A_8141 [Trichinella pseudospiralis]KRY64203.1 hypothetical protein T4A_4425 [Trichinella pseudospiralis]KRY80902.1 hypothetical protein T4D_4311 [Trichinella pseudospiralis]KRY81013.1 hypothetical protein T4D_3581 [Trichinella pseudospiralis]